MAVQVSMLSLNKDGFTCASIRKIDDFNVVLHMCCTCFYPTTGKYLDKEDVLCGFISFFLYVEGRDLQPLVFVINLFLLYLIHCWAPSSSAASGDLFLKQ